MYASSYICLLIFARMCPLYVCIYVSSYVCVSCICAYMCMRTHAAVWRHLCVWGHMQEYEDLLYVLLYMCPQVSWYCCILAALPLLAALLLHLTPHMCSISQRTCFQPLSVGRTSLDARPLANRTSQHTLPYFYYSMVDTFVCRAFVCSKAANSGKKQLICSSMQQYITTIVW